MDSKERPRIPLNRLFDNVIILSPLTGEGEGGGEKKWYSHLFYIPPPLYPLPPGEGKGIVG